MGCIGLRASVADEHTRTPHRRGPYTAGASHCAERAARGNDPVPGVLNGRAGLRVLTLLLRVLTPLRVLTLRLRVLTPLRVLTLLRVRTPLRVLTQLLVICATSRIAVMACSSRNFNVTCQARHGHICSRTLAATFAQSLHRVRRPFPAGCAAAGRDRVRPLNPG